MSALESLHFSTEHRHPTVIEILLLRKLERKGFDIIFSWVPGHVGVLGNEQADTAARSMSDHMQRPVCYRDLKTSTQNNIHRVWQETWDQQILNKLHNIHPSTSHWAALPMRRHDVRLTRLRIGHSFHAQAPSVGIQVIPSTSLFATCSNDGTVKIWDCEKMEGKNVANRSRLSYNRLEGPVSCMTVCQNMQSIAAASETGNIQVFRLIYDNIKSSLLHVRNLDPVEEGCVVDIDYFDTGSQSVLAYATVTGSIVGWDLRSPGTAWKLENDAQKGLITSFCTDPHHCWLVVGTSRGNMICWDLRFQLPITTITHPTNSRIRNMLVHPRKRSSIFTSVQGNNEVSLWDLETQGRLMTLWSEKDIPPLSQTQKSRSSIYSMCWSYPEQGSSLLTAGSDMRIRHWDLKNPSNSHIIVGAAYETPVPFTNTTYK
ncbi:phosphoinositide 3-kinase regulatory subunit 4 [Trichonephila clavipes]|nr:phosphoinositide 3-kinase regulatory subunit 4 [Trichonephila clavipes]